MHTMTQVIGPSKVFNLDLSNVFPFSNETNYVKAFYVIFYASSPLYLSLLPLQFRIGERNEKREKRVVSLQQDDPPTRKQLIVAENFFHFWEAIFLEWKNSPANKINIYFCDYGFVTFLTNTKILYFLIKSLQKKNQNVGQNDFDLKLEEVLRPGQL